MTSEEELELTKWRTAAAAKDARIELLKEELKLLREETRKWEQKWREAVERIESLTGGVS